MRNWREKSNEFDIRKAVVSKLIADGVKRENIRIEIPLDTASSEGRADIVLIDDWIKCIELKSGKDRFCPDAITEQCAQYKRSFDYVAIIVDGRHREVWKKEWDDGRTQHSNNWHCVDATYHHHLGILCARYKDTEAKNLASEIFAHRKSARTCAYDMSLLLWLDEIKKIAGSGAQKSAFCQDIRENGKLSEIRPLVIKALRGRVYNKWEEDFWKKFDNEVEVAK